MALKDLVSRPERTSERPGAAAAGSAQPAPTAETAAKPQPAQTPRPSGGTTFLDASTVFEGVIQSRESLRLDGRVKGEIRCEQSVVVGESAKLEAAVHADAVVVAGEVRGDIAASRKITLGATARVVGDLTTPGIVIEEGAMLEGRIQIGPKASAAEAQPRPKPKAEGAEASKPREREAQAQKPSAPPPGPPPSGA